MSKRKRYVIILLVFVFILSTHAYSYCCSIAGAIGDYTTDGRPVLWKNRDSWSTEDCWKTYAYYYEASEQRPYETIDYIGITDPDSSWSLIPQDPKTTTTSEKSTPQKPFKTFKIPWAGANTAGLGLVQSSAHTLDNVSSCDQDSLGINNGMLNHLILSSCTTVDDVEQLLRDTNNGWSQDYSQARNTNSLIMVFDKYGHMVTFEVTGTDFTRDNTVGADYGNNINGTIYYKAEHTDDKDSTNPTSCSGIDWRTNFAKVNYQREDGFEFFVDNYKTIVQDNQVENTVLFSDGIDDRETSTSSIKRWTRTGARMDDNKYFPENNPNLSIDYRYFIQKYVGSYGIPNTTPYENNYYETIARSIGELPANDKPTGWHLNRFVTTFSVVIVGNKPGDVDDGILTTIWVALGEPACTVFVPLFPSTGEVPSALSDMYSHSNNKRHEIYNYVDDDCLGYNSGRNITHTLSLAELVGLDPYYATSNYYGEGGIQQPIFQLEDNAFDSYDSFCNICRSRISNGIITSDRAISGLIDYQNDMAVTIKNHYINGTTGSSPLLNPSEYLSPPQDPK